MTFDSVTQEQRSVFPIKANKKQMGIRIRREDIKHEDRTWSLGFLIIHITKAKKWNTFLFLANLSSFQNIARNVLD